METHTFPFLSSSGGDTLHLSLLHNVRNVSTILSSLRSGKPDPSFPSSITARDLSSYAFLDASLVVSRKQVVNAAVQAIMARERGEMKTRAWSTEVMWVLWPGGNISDSLKNVGLSATSSSLVVVRLCSSSSSEHSRERVLEQLTTLVEGDLDPKGLDALGISDSSRSDAVTDWEKVKRIHRLVPPPAPADGAAEEGEMEWIRRVVESTTGIKAVAG